MMGDNLQLEGHAAHEFFKSSGYKGQALSIYSYLTKPSNEQESRKTWNSARPWACRPAQVGVVSSASRLHWKRMRGEFVAGSRFIF